MNDDASVIKQVRSGDSNAFSLLVRKYQDRLFHCLLNLTGDAHEAEDLSQDAFVQAYLKLRSFGEQSGFFTWLYRIAFNLAASRHRRKKPALSLDRHDDTPGVEPQDSLELPLDKLARDERAVQVRAALETLIPEFRAVVVLREMEGCDYDTIAQILEIPVGTVRSRLARARMELRERLQPLLQELS